MDLRTSIVALSMAISPATTKAETKMQQAKKPMTENIAKVVKSTEAYGKSLVKNSIGQPALKRTPKPEMANLRVINADKTQVQYDAHGNISAMFNVKGQKYREISRDMDGNLQGYIDISYKNGIKNKETLYYVDTNDSNRLIRYAEHTFNGNGTATVVSFDGNEIVSKSLFKTTKDNGEEIILDSGFIESIQ